MRRPASAGTERRPNRKGLQSQTKTTKKPAETQEIDRHSYAVCDGQITVGHVEQIGDAYTATGTDGRPLGIFATLIEASRAIPATTAARGAP
jgi:hypothetical protein